VCGRGQEHQVDGLVVDDLTQIGMRSRALSRELFELGGPLRQHGFVDITDGREFQILAGEFVDAIHVHTPAAFDADHGGTQAVVAGPDNRVYPLVMHEIPPGWDITRESASYHLASEIAFRDVNPEEYQGLFLTGGRAPEYIRYDQDLMRIVRHFFTAEKPVA